MSIPYPFHVHKEQSVPIRTNRLGVFYHHSSKTHKYPISARNLVGGANLRMHPTKPSLEEASAAYPLDNARGLTLSSQESLSRVGEESSTNITTRW